jgi:hypothetical protein
VPSPAQAQAGAPNAAAGGVTLQGEPAPGRGGVQRRVAGGPSVTAVRAAQPPAVDGRLDDAVWRTAAHLTTFVQQTPIEGAPATEQTEVHVAYDNERLYFGIHAHYSEKSLIRANRVDRDKTENDDTVTVVFDPFLDQQQGYSFSVNGYGVQGDALIRTVGGGNNNQGGGTGGGGNNNQGGGGGNFQGGGIPQGDLSWNALFASAGQLVDDGWTAEMAIPFKSLRYPSRGNGEAHRWGFQVMREIHTKFETVVWAPMSRDIAGFLRQMGTLDGMTNLSTSRNFELLPSFTAVRSGTLNKTTGEFSTTDVEEGGVNLKYGLSSTLTLDFTFNPDFSQIEADRQQIEVNQRFPVQYPELRPFFLEGADIFRIQPAPLQVVHTRTIVDPRFGAKLTGKVGKTTIGFMVANDEAPGKVTDPIDPLFGKTAKIGMARVRYDYRAESHLGALFTDRELLDGHSRIVAYDSQLRIGRNYQFSANGAFSDHRTAAGVQNPDGHMFLVLLRRESRNLGYFIAHHQESPDFRSDIGFIRRVDQKVTTGNISYRWWPQSWIVNWGPQFNYDRSYTFDGTLQNAGPGTQLNVQFAKNINLSASVSRDLERYREIDFYKTRVSFTGGVNTSRRVSFQGSINRGDEIRFIDDPYLGHTSVYNFSTTLRPISRLQSTINLDTTRFMDVRTHTRAFDIKILRVQTTYQFTDRLLVRNIMQRNTFTMTLDANLLVTYRVNSGTAFYVGYDDHYARADAINADVFPGTEFRQTNRAIFTKLQYLFRNGASN